MHPQFLAQAAGALSESAPSEDAKAAVVTGLNDVLRRREFYAGPAFGEAELPAEAQRLLDKGVLNLFVTELEFLNRHLLEYALPGCLAAHAAGAEGISFTEFSYQTMQAYDFLQLHRDMNCTVQVGGSDQWGNITAGIDLIRRIEGAEAYGLTVPLMKTASGEKFGKSAGNAVWLDPERTSPYEFYQYWMRTDDRDVERFMKTFTFLPVEEIREIAAAHREHPERREGQRRLAEEVTRMAHGQEALEVAQKASQVLFGQEIAGFADAELRAIFADVPSATFERSRLEEGLGVVELLGSTVCNSNGEARRLIKNGGAYLNNRKVADPNATVTPDDLASESFLVLRSGKKRYHLVQFD
jgi:tyrosyl-tRNA synthetase